MITCFRTLANSHLTTLVRPLGFFPPTFLECFVSPSWRSVFCHVVTFHLWTQRELFRCHFCYPIQSKISFSIYWVIFTKRENGVFSYIFWKIQPLPKKTSHTLSIVHYDILMNAVYLTACRYSNCNSRVECFPGAWLVIKKTKMSVAESETALPLFSSSTSLHAYNTSLTLLLRDRRVIYKNDALHWCCYTRPQASPPISARERLPRSNTPTHSWSNFHSAVTREFDDGRGVLGR